MSECQRLLDVVLPRFQLLHLLRQYLQNNRFCHTDAPSSSGTWWKRRADTGARTKVELTRCGTTAEILMQLLAPAFGEAEQKNVSEWGYFHPTEELRISWEADLAKALHVLETHHVISVGLGSSEFLRPQDLQYLRQRILALPLHYWEDKTAPVWEAPEAREIVLVPGYQELKDRDMLSFPGHGFIIVRTGPNSYDVVESYIGRYQVQRRAGLTNEQVRRLLHEYWALTVGKSWTAEDALAWNRLTGGGDLGQQVGMRKTYALPLVWQPGHPALRVQISMRVEYYPVPSHCNVDATVGLVDHALMFLQFDPRREAEFMRYVGLSKATFQALLTQFRDELLRGAPRRSERVYRPQLPLSDPPALLRYSRRRLSFLPLTQAGPQ